MSEIPPTARPKISDAQRKALNQYCQVMEEIKVRVRVIESTLNGKTGLDKYFAQEFCYLQLRMICELIALGCLVAHGEITETRRIKKEWSALTIMSGLENLHPDFYPLPVDHGIEGAIVVSMTEHKEPDFLTKTELIKLNGICGNFLHRGTFANIFEVRRRRPVNFAAIANYAQRAMNLLSSHFMILLRTETVLFHCLLASAARNGQASAALMVEE